MGVKFYMDVNNDIQINPNLKKTFENIFKNILLINKKVVQLSPPVLWQNMQSFSIILIIEIQQMSYIYCSRDFYNSNVVRRTQALTLLLLGPQFYTFTVILCTQCTG